MGVKGRNLSAAMVFKKGEGVREERGSAWRCKEFVIAHIPGELMETAAALRAI
jgi:hypothetical protein